MRQGRPAAWAAGRCLVGNIADRCLKEPGMRVLYMSGYLDDSLQQHGVSMERDDFIRKPFSVKSLLAAMVRALLR